MASLNYSTTKKIKNSTLNKEWSEDGSFYKTLYKILHQKSTINKFDSITVLLHSFYSVDSELIYKYRCDQAGNTLSTHCPIGNQLTIVPWVTISSADNITIVYINIKQIRRL